MLLLYTTEEACGLDASLRTSVEADNKPALMITCVSHLTCAACLSLGLYWSSSVACQLLSNDEIEELHAL